MNKPAIYFLVGSCRSDERAVDTSSQHIMVLANVRVGTSVGSEKPVPKGVDHREIAVRMQMVDEVKLLLAPEPSEAS